MRYYSKSTGCTYIEGIHSAMPADAVLITEEIYLTVIANPAVGKIRSHDADGLPILIDPPPILPTESELCGLIDLAADKARLKVAGDPLRAIEYDRAATQAKAFAEAGYTGEVPAMVAAWAVNGRTAQQAADDILREAAQYNAALESLRAVRLSAKEQIRALMEADEVEQAKVLTAQAVASIEAAVAGIGNNSN